MPGMPDTAGLVNFWHLEPTGDHCGRLRDSISGALGTFTRATVKTVFDPTTGRIHDVAAGSIAAIPFAGIKTGGRGWAYSIEEARTNYVTNSYGAANSGGVWTGGWGLVETVSGAPTTTLAQGVYGATAQRIQYTGVADTAATSYFDSPRSAASSFAEGENAVGSVYAKGAVTGITPQLIVLAWTDAGVFLGSANGTLALNANSFGRTAVTYSGLPATTGKANIRISTPVIDTGDTIDVTFSAAQLEKGAFATSYIPTTTAAATRNADVLTVPTTGWSAAAGTIVAVNRASGAGTSAAGYQVTWRASSAEIISLYRGAALYMGVTTGSALKYDEKVYAEGVSAGVWANGASVRVYANGVAGVRADAAGTPTGLPATATIGANAATSGFWNGYLGPIAAYNVAKTDAEVAAASTAMEYGYAPNVRRGCRGRRFTTRTRRCG